MEKSSGNYPHILGKAQEKMINTYKKLLAPRGTAPPSSAISAGLLSVSVAAPVLLAMIVYNPAISLITLSVLLSIVGLSFFFDVKNFAIYVFPLIFLYANHDLIFVIVVLFAVSFLAGRLQAGVLTINIAFPVVLGLLVIAGLIGVTRANEVLQAQYLLRFNLILPLLVFVIFYNLEPSNKSIADCMRMICVIGALIGWISLGRYFVVGYTRVIVGWASFNPAGCFFGMILPFAIMSVLYEKNKGQRLGYWFLLLGIFAGIFVTQSRATYLTSLITMGFFAWKDRRVFKVMLPVFIAGIIILPSLILYRIMMMFGMGAAPDWSSIGRVQIWMNSFELLRQYWLMGMGIDSFRYIYPTNYPISIVRAEHPHNVFLRWWFEYGLIGISAYLYIIASTFRKALKCVKVMKKDKWNEDDRLLLSLSTGFLASLIASMVDSPFHHPQVIILFWMFIAYQLILIRRRKEL